MASLVIVVPSSSSLVATTFTAPRFHLRKLIRRCPRRCSYLRTLPYTDLHFASPNFGLSLLHHSLSNFDRITIHIGKAASSDLSASSTDTSEPISLGTVKLPSNVDLQKLEAFLYQWGTSLTQNANLPLPVPIKVDKIEGGVRLGYIRLVDGAIEDLAHIDCVVSPASQNSKAMFRAVRSGRFKNEVPPGEPLIMQSLLQALKKSIELSTVDKIEGGVRLGYIRLVDGAIEDLAHIDCVVSPASQNSKAMFRAVRSGRFKNEVPPGEPLIMQSLLQALKKSIELSTV